MLITAAEVRKASAMMRALAIQCTEIADELDAWDDPSAATAERVYAKIKQLVLMFAVTVKKIEEPFVGDKKP